MTGSGHLREDDSVLVEAVQAGDLGAYEELFRRHHTSVKRVCAKRLGNPVEADEVAQAAFVRAFERIDRCIGDRRFGAWVQVIARRLCVDMIRARTRTTPDDDPVRDERPALNVVSDVDAGTATEEALARRERTERIHEALALLPDRQRAVVVARHLEGRRPPEIAAALGLSVGAVDSLLLRARRRLAVNYEHVQAEGGAAAVPAASTPAVTTGGGGPVPAPLGSVPDAVAGLVREVAVALPAGAGAVPTPMRRVVAAIVTAAAPAVSGLPAPSPPPHSGPPAAVASAVAQVRARPSDPAVPSVPPPAPALPAVEAPGGADPRGGSPPLVGVPVPTIPAPGGGLPIVTPSPAGRTAGTGASVQPALPPIPQVLGPPPAPPPAAPVPAPPGAPPADPVAAPPPGPPVPVPPLPVPPPALQPVPVVPPVLDLPK